MQTCFAIGSDASKIFSRPWKFDVFQTLPLNDGVMGKNGIFSEMSMLDKIKLENLCYHRGLLMSLDLHEAKNFKTFSI